MASFTLAELKAQIDACPNGGAVGLPHDTYADLFPPGERARSRQRDISGCAVRLPERAGATLTPRRMAPRACIIRPCQLGGARRGRLRVTPPEGVNFEQCGSQNEAEEIDVAA
jgi:hypothetical protein